jgi:hypothetical protein
MLERLRDDTAKCADASLWSLSDTDLETALQQVHRLQQTVTALLLHLIAEVGGRDLPGVQQVRGLPLWLRLRLVLDPATARRLVDQAAALQRHPAVDAALCAGTIHLRQADAITDALDALPTTEVLAAGSASDPAWTDDAAGAAERDGQDGLRGGIVKGVETEADGMASGEPMSADDVVSAAEVTAAAEEALLGFAAEFAPAPLRRLGTRILDHVAPQVAERLEAKALERAERRAWRQRGLTLSPPTGGMVRLSGHLTVEDAATISAVLDPLSGPTGGRDADSRSPAQARADALVEVCRLALRTGELPDSGGEPPQLAVTVALDPLTRRLGVGRLDGGDRVSPSAVRRLACDARILPLLLGGTGQVLDAGRARRLATGPLRRALVVRDRGCCFPACDRSPRWADAHHIRSWTRGGGTDLANLVLLCRHHHRLIHEGDWTVRMAADGLPEFLPPPVLGQPQPPRRNPYHRRT